MTRVEVSLDAGETWRLCDIDRPERPTKHGRYWCWVLWELDVDVTDFLQSKELVVRAWDSALNTQADRLTWNVMVRPHPSIDCMAFARTSDRWSARTLTKILARPNHTTMFTCILTPVRPSIYPSIMCMAFA